MFVLTQLSTGLYPSYCLQHDSRKVLQPLTLSLSPKLTTPACAIVIRVLGVV